jgi:hypothetical protein
MSWPTPQELAHYTSYRTAGPLSIDGKRLDPSAGWTWNRHGYYDSPIPETFTYVHFSTRVVGTQSTKTLT